MALYHFHVTQVKRSAGQSVVNSTAYRAGEKLYSDYYGGVFLAGNGMGLSRKRIWTEMKVLCREAGVAATKVYPHNLRHLFARLSYQACRDIVQLADVLGHSSAETTRIYLISTGDEHARQIERLRLVS